MEKNYGYTCDAWSLDNLAPGVLDAFEAACAEYTSATGDKVTVTSGRRTLRRNAELMSEFTPSVLESMYCRNGYPSYIRELIAKRNELGRQLTGDEAYAILATRSEGYISAHLYGAAIDVLADGLKSKELLVEILSRSGFRTLDETECGIPCIHATYKSIPVEIIRE